MTLKIIHGLQPFSNAVNPERQSARMSLLCKHCCDCQLVLLKKLDDDDDDDV